MQNSINWFEIPVMDFNRAVTFYSKVMEVELQHMPMGDAGDMAMFPMEGQEGVSGSLIRMEEYKSSADGTRVYFHCGNDLQPYLDRIEPAGGKVVVPKTLITEDIGHFAMFIDTEGNTVCLHSNNPDKGIPVANTVADWFEIPVTDFERASAFYGKVVGGDMYQMEMGGYMMGFFPMEEGQRGVGGAIVKGDGYVPSLEGCNVYLNGGADLQPLLDRALEAGGTVLIPKKKISDEYGYFAFFMDTEGNRVSLHSMG